VTNGKLCNSYHRQQKESF